MILFYCISSIKYEFARKISYEEIIDEFCQPEHFFFLLKFEIYIAIITNKSIIMRLYKLYS